MGGRENFESIFKFKSNFESILLNKLLIGKVKQATDATLAPDFLVKFGLNR